MSRRDSGVVVVLGVLAVFIWVRDLSWVTAAGDVLPVLAGFPVFVWLGAPWRFGAGAGTLPASTVVVSALGFVLGIISGLTVLLAAGWTFLLYGWLRSRVESPPGVVLRRLLILPLLAFPWITLDLHWLGWSFRLTAASVIAWLFHVVGFTVAQNGTNLLVQGLPISVEAACSGMNTLQATLIGGSALAFIFLGRQKHYWWNVAGLIALAWVANTARIFALVVAALTFGAEFAQGMFHTWGGWLVLVLMFLLCWLVFAVQRRAPGVAPVAS